MGLLVDVTQVYLQLTSNDKTSIWRTPYSEKRPAGTVRTAAWLSSPFVASSLANIQWQQFRYMADAIQREDACQGELELLHGRRTARKTNAVKIATDVTQARLFPIKKAPYRPEASIHPYPFADLSYRPGISLLYVQNIFPRIYPKTHVFYILMILLQSDIFYYFLSI